MRRRVTTAPDALKALRQARSRLTQKGSGPNGQARWKALRDSRKQLRSYPYLGTAIEGHSGRYQMVISEHRVIYRVDPDTGESATAGNVRVIAVFGPGQP
jgi:plasmid stabilization system protein ParE